MKKIITSLLISLITILSLNGCFGPSEYAFDNILISDTRNEKTLKIESPFTTFSSNTPVIYGQAYFTNPNEGNTTYILINFSLLTDNEPEILDSSTKNTQQGGLMIFEGKRPGLSWPIGTYTIDFIVNDVIYASQQFDIISTDDTALSEKSTWIEDTQTSKTVDSSHNPTSPTSNFASNTEEIYLTIKASDKMAKNTTIEIEWRYLDKSELVISQKQTISKNQSIHFTFDRTHNKNFLETSGDWKSGSYQATILIDNTPVKKVLFKIS